MTGHGGADASGAPDMERAERVQQAINACGGSVLVALAAAQAEVAALTQRAEGAEKERDRWAKTSNEWADAHVALQGELANVTYDLTEARDQLARARELIQAGEPRFIGEPDRCIYCGSMRGEPHGGCEWANLRDVLAESAQGQVCEQPEGHMGWLSCSVHGAKVAAQGRHKENWAERITKAKEAREAGDTLRQGQAKAEGVQE